MNGSSRLAAWCIAALVGIGAALGPVAAAQTVGSEGGGASASSYEYTPETRENLIARRSAFDPSDGLQRWERMLLAMDPNGATDAGR
jgi:hypothetical protein